MVCKIIWTEHASDDLAAVVRYVAHDNPEAARRLGYGLYEQIQILAQFPELGSVVREFGDPAWRQMTHRPYRVIYHLNAANRSSRSCISGTVREATWSCRLNFQIL